MNNRVEKVLKLARDTTTRIQADKLTGVDDDALFIAALASIDATFSTDEYTKYIERYFENLLFLGLEVSNTRFMPLAYTASIMYKKTGNKHYQFVLDKIIAFIREGVDAGIPISRKGISEIIVVEDIYYCLPFLSHYARENCDLSLTAYLEKCIKFYANVLYVKSEGLFKKYYNVVIKQCYPPTNVYWTKGNGYALLGLSECYDYSIGKQRNLLADLLPRLGCSLWKHVHNNGYYGTALNSFSPKDATSTAYVTAGLMKAYALDLLTEDCYTTAIHSFNALVDDMLVENGLLVMDKVRKSPNYVLGELFKSKRFTTNKSVGAVAGVVTAALIYQSILER